MSTNALLIGGAGTGKTTRLMESVEKMLERKIDPFEIGYVSFTNAATNNALSRASDRFDLNQKKLQNDGWFKTLHSICYRCLDVKRGQILIGENEADKKWFRENVGFTPGDSVGMAKTWEEDVIKAWDVCRQRNESWLQTTTKLGGLSYERSSELIKKYETCKRINGLYDFTDLLGRFAGISFSTSKDGHATTQPEGWVPHLECLIVDEAQDNSALMDLCLRRIAASTRYAILAGDPWQSIFSFSGSDHSRFMSWEFQKKEIMPQSWRCPQQILELGEKCIMHCPDWFDRNIKPTDKPGSISSSHGCRSVIYDVMSSDVADSWLMLSRSNYHLSKYTKDLKINGIPYTMTNGGSPWVAPSRNSALFALMMLQDGKAIDAKEWSLILGLKDLPVKFGDLILLETGTKSSWKKRNPDSMGELSDVNTLSKWGATDNMKKIISSGEWASFIPFAREYTKAVGKYGVDAVNKPKVVVSTIHGAKGMEATNVALLDTTSMIVKDAALKSDDVRYEEHRIAYVGVTRARRSLFLVSEKDQRNRMKIG